MCCCTLMGLCGCPTCAYSVSCYPIYRCTGESHIQITIELENHMIQFQQYGAHGSLYLYRWITWYLTCRSHDPPVNMYTNCTLLSLSSLQSMYPLSTMSIKRGLHSEQWPWPVEVLHKQETIHASLSSDRDRQLLISCVGRQEGMPTTPTTPSRVSEGIVLNDQSSLNDIVRYLSTEIIRGMSP